MILHTLIFNTFLLFTWKFILLIVTVRLHLPDSQVQIFVQSTISMNTSWRKLGGIWAAEFVRCYSYVLLHCHHLCRSYTHHEKLGYYQTKLQLQYITRSVCSRSHNPLWSLTSQFPFWNVFPFVKAKGSLQENPFENMCLPI